MGFFSQPVGEVFDVEQRKTELEQWRGECSVEQRERKCSTWNKVGSNVPRGTLEGSRGVFGSVVVDSRLSFFGQSVGEVVDVEQRKTEVEQWRGECPWNNENANVPRGTMEGSRGLFG